MHGGALPALPLLPMTTRTKFRILVLDHRQSGWEQRLSIAPDEGFEWRFSRNLRDSQQLLAEGGFDLVVLDPLVEGGQSEIELVGLDEQAPLLLYLCSEPVRAEALPRLALRKREFDLAARDGTVEELGWRMESLLARSLAHAQIEELRHRALYDERTGLLRGGVFEERVREHFSASRRHQLPVCLLLIDLDRFGQINKRLDHTAGDRALNRVADAIRSQLRTEDLAGRLGGDEFGVLLPYTSPAQGARVVVRLLEALRALNPGALPADSGLRIGASVGFESANGRDVESAELLREHAESALRAAKQRGGDCGVYFRSLGPRSLPKAQP